MRHAVDRPSGLYRSRNAVHATLQVHAGAPRNPGAHAGAPRTKKGRRSGPPPWSGPPSSARALATLYTTDGPRPVQRPAEEISSSVESRVDGRDCSIWMTISVAKRPKRTFHHAPNMNDHH